MAQSSTCKKCLREVLPGPECPLCGGKLSKPHTLWRVQRRPLLDWGCWNAPLRVLLPLSALLAAGLLGAEAALGGRGGAERMLRGDTPRVLLALFLGALALVALALALRGREVLEYAADERGVTERVLLPRPGALCLLAHLRSPRLARDASRQREFGLLYSEQTLPWAQVKRAALWQEKSLLLLYSPGHWLRMALPCTAEAWPDVQRLIQDKLGRRKDLKLPAPLLPPQPRNPDT